MRFKKVFLLFVFTAASFITLAQTVHYTKTGHKYHSAGCRYLRQSDYTCSLKEALEMNLTACSRCDPPTAVVKDTQPKKKAIKKGKKISYHHHDHSENICELPGNKMYEKIY